MENKIKISINLEKLVQIIMLFLFYRYLLKLVQTNLINKFLNPKFNIYITLSLIFISLAILIQMKVLLTTKNKKIFKLKYLIFVIMLIILYSTPAGSISSDMANLRGVNVGSNKTIYDINNNISNDVTTKNNNIDQQKDSLDSSNISTDDSKINNAQEPIVIKTENYFAVLNEIFTNPALLEGRSVKIQGFVFIPKSGEFPADRFALARMAIVCCAADAQLAGIICKCSNRILFTEKNWYEVEGIVKNDKNENGELVPYLEVVNYKYLEKHDDDYVYP